MGTLLKIRSFWANDLFWKKKNLKYTAVFFKKKTFKKKKKKKKAHSRNIHLLRSSLLSLYMTKVCV